MDILKFDDNISVKEALGYAVFPGKCYNYTYIGIIITLILYLIIAATFIKAFQSSSLFEVVGIFISSIISSIFIIYVNAYLRKGCEAANLIKDFKNKKISEIKS